VKTIVQPATGWVLRLDRFGFTAMQCNQLPCDVTTIGLFLPSKLPPISIPFPTLPIYTCDITPLYNTYRTLLLYNIWYLKGFFCIYKPIRRGLYPSIVTYIIPINQLHFTSPTIKGNTRKGLRVKQLSVSSGVPIHFCSLPQHKYNHIYTS
jgi:hypothetical protein